MAVIRAQSACHAWRKSCNKRGNRKKQATIKKFRIYIEMSGKQKQQFDYFVAVDFQITQFTATPHQQDIVEINAVAVNAVSLIRRKVFAGCCHPDLADFSFADATRKFTQWLRQLNGSFLLVTDNYDALGVHFPNQCVRSGIDVPWFALEWINVLEFWRQRYGNRKKVTCDLLLEHFGRNRVLQNGKRTSQSDAQSLSIVIVDLLKAHRNFVFRQNERFECVQI